MVPILRQRGMALIERDAGNFALALHPDLLIKDITGGDGSRREDPPQANPKGETSGCERVNYWRWPPHDKVGNAIDFFVQVLGPSFHEAMRIITPPAPCRPIRSYWLGELHSIRPI